MRCALCLHGLVGGNRGGMGIGSSVPMDVCFKHYKEHLLNHNEVDVFVHCWNPPFENKIIELYQPKKSIFEPLKKAYGKIRGPRTKEYRFCSRWYGNQQVIKLKKEYEEEQGFKYDFVMVSRFDLLWFSDVIFSQFDPKYFYVSFWNLAPYESRKKYRQVCRKYHSSTNPLNFDNLTDNVPKFQDLWFFSNSANMDIFGDLFNHLPNYSLKSPHADSFRHVAQNIGDPKQVVRFAFRRWYDWELFRRKYGDDPISIHMKAKK